MNFNKERFANFAKYDLAINQVFYRNLSLVTLVGTVGIAMVGFMGRYTMWKGTHTNGMPDDYDMDMGLMTSSYNDVAITAYYLLIFLTIMMFIFAGCWAHNLRNKQGRITELTLPATNWEKFLWHTGLMIGGGLVLCVASLLVADGLNALLTLAVYGSRHGVGSLTATVSDFFTMDFITNGIMSKVMVNGQAMGAPQELAIALPFFRSIGFFIITHFICEVAIYMFGNALKYKYNIILTYIALQVLGIVFAILVLVGVAVFADNVDHITEVENGAEMLFRDMTAAAYVVGALALVLTAVLSWKSYHLYTRAQITAPLNK